MAASTGALTGAAFGPYATGEQTLAPDLLAEFEPGMVVPDWNGRTNSTAPPGGVRWPPGRTVVYALFGYGLRQLTTHLSAAGRPDDLPRSGSPATSRSRSTSAGSAPGSDR